MDQEDWAGCILNDYKLTIVTDESLAIDLGD